MIVKKLNKLTKIIVFFACFLNTSYFADQLRLNIGFWPGNLDPELQPRFFNDDLIEGFGIGRLDLEWANKNTNTIYPLGFQYFKKAGKGNIVFGANWIYYAPEYKFNGIYPFNAISIVTLKNFNINDIEADIGYQFQFGQIFLTPKIGGRWHNQFFKYNELTLGRAIGVSFGKNDFEANAFGTYFGVDFQFYLENNLSFVFEYLNTGFFPGFAGDMEFKTTTIIDRTIKITNQSSSYDVKIQRIKIGLQFDIGKNNYIQFGLREETQIHSYPGYINLGFIIRPNQTDFGLDTFNEIITDIIFWEKQEEQKKGLLFFAFSFGLSI